VVAAALSAAGASGRGTINDMIGSARMGGGCQYGALHVVYENLTYRLELDHPGQSQAPTIWQHDDLDASVTQFSGDIRLSRPVVLELGCALDRLMADR
jgi:hypothetical protein